MDQRITVTVAHALGRVDVAVTPDSDVASLITTLHPDFRGRASLTSGADLSPFDTVASRLTPGSVVVLVDDDSQAREQSAEQAEHGRWVQQLGLLRAVIWVIAVALVVIPWLLPHLAGAFGLGWAPVILGLASAVAVIADLIASTATRRRPLGVGWVVVAAALVGLALARLIIQGWGTNPTTGLVAAAWLAVTFSLALSALVDAPVLRTVAGLGFAASLAATLMLIVPSGVAIIAPLVLAAAAMLLVIAPRVAPQVPDEQLADMPLLMTSAPQTWPITVRSPAKITAPRAQGIVNQASTSWTVLTLAASLVITLTAWPVTATAQFHGLTGWGATVTLVAVTIVFSCAPIKSSEPVVKVVSRGAAVLVLVEWLFNGYGSLAGLPVPVVVAGVVGVGVGVVVTVWAGQRPQGAPLLGRLGDVTVTLAQLVVLPAALLASGLLFTIWHAIL